MPSGMGWEGDWGGEEGWAEGVGAGWRVVVELDVWSWSWSWSLT